MYTYIIQSVCTLHIVLYFVYRVSFTNADFIFNGSLIWNRTIKILETPTIHEISVEVFKGKLKQEIHKRQKIGDKFLWNNENMSF